MIRFRGPNSSPGLETSTDRSGTSSAPITPPIRHPFAVQCLGLKDGKAHFCIHEGNVFAGGELGPNLVTVDLGTITPNYGSTTPDPLKVSNGNIGTTYSFPLTTGSKILYVRIQRATALDQFEIKMVAKDQTEMATEQATSPAAFVATGETALGDASHGGFPVSMVTSAGMCGVTYTLTVNQQGKKFRSNGAWVGTYTYPIAVFSKLGETAQAGQVLRSDIFFPYGRAASYEYIDTAVTQISLEASGTCPCGCGCGGCCGTGCCTCGEGGGCGCVPPGCG